MTIIKGSTALVTGGANGLGKAMARLFLKEGVARLIIWDINGDGLQAACRDFHEYSSRIRLFAIDVGDHEQVRAGAEKICRICGGVDILVNNAGVATGNDFAGQKHASISRTVSTNISGPMHCTLELLPAMQNKGSGHIVNISSAAALVPLPGLSVYSASKSALAVWGDALRMEFRTGNQNIKVTSVFSGHLDTDMFRGVKGSLCMPVIEHDRAAEKIIAGIRSNRQNIYMPFSVWVASAARAVLPGRFFDLCSRLAGLDRYMLGFRENNE